MCAEPGVFSGARQSREQRYLADRVVVRGAGWVGRRAGAGRAGKVEKATVVGGEGVWSRETAEVSGIRAKELDAVKQFLLVDADSAARVGFGQQRHAIRARRLPRCKDGALWIRFCKDPERSAMLV